MSFLRAQKRTYKVAEFLKRNFPEHLNIFLSKCYRHFAKEGWGVRAMEAIKCALAASTFKETQIGEEFIVEF